MKSDGERAIVKMKMEAAKKARGVRKAAPEESPAGDSKANGVQRRIEGGNPVASAGLKGAILLPAQD